MLHVIHSHAPETKEAAIERLDIEIHRLTEQLRAVKAHRNSYSSSYVLPAEILSEVFSIVQESCKGWTSGPVKLFTSFRAWLPITHVSQHWRRVALEATQLWCEIHDIPNLAIPAFLERSKGRNLSVTTSCSLSAMISGYTYEPAQLAEILSQGHRIERLSIGSSALPDILPYLTSSSPPILKELYISGNDINIPDDIYQGSTPQLRSLSLSGCRFNIDSPLLMNDLTKLHISQCTKAPPQTWINLLQHMPRLSLLTFADSFQSGTVSEESTGHLTASNDIGIVSLLQLSKLEIRESSFEESLDFLAHITFPSTTQLTFAAASTTAEPAIPPLVTFLQVHNNSRQDASAMEIKIIEFVDEYQDGTHMHLVASVDSACPNPLDVRVSAHEVFNEVDIINMTHLIALASLPLSSVTSFTMNFQLNADGWRFLSDTLPNLGEISVSHKAVDSFLSSLGACEVEDTSDADVVGPMEGGTSTTAAGEGDIPFRSVQTIIFCNISLKLHHLQDRIASALQTRRDCGFPINTVKFTRCVAGSEDFVSRLEGTVDVDVVDGWKVEHVLNPWADGWDTDWDYDPTMRFEDTEDLDSENDSSSLSQ